MRRRSLLLAACLCGLVASAATAKPTASLKLLRVRTVHSGAVAVTLRCARGSGTCQATVTLRGRTSDGRAAARIPRAARGR
jgi:hypothetical protein